MPLVSMLAGLHRAQEGGYAVPCFDTFELMGTVGIFAALGAKRAPGIVGLYSGLLDQPEASAVAAMVRTMAQHASVPVSLALDHGADFEHCIKALSLGFTDVMYDGSRLDLEENIAQTRAVVRAAHAVGVGVEAELGHVGTGRSYQSFGALGMGFTDPDAVVEFVDRTDVDCLAIAIGTAHGHYEGEPRLALDRLAEIRERVAIPLVLHGGSGLSDEQFRSAIAGGIAKVNIFTDLAASAGARMIEVARGDGASYLSLVRAIPAAFQGPCERLLDVFGASGRG